MNNEKLFKISFGYGKVFLKWLLVASLTGLLSGIVGSIFHKLLDFVTEFRMENTYITYLMPLGVILITLMYSAFEKGEALDTNLVIAASREDKKVPFVLVPLIFLGTVITQFFGGSAGREGAALQIGGGIGYNLAKIFKLNKNDVRIITMAGMSGVFSALFGTPVAAAVFSLEVARVGVLNFTALLPCIVSSAVAYSVSLVLGVRGASVVPLTVDGASLLMIGKIALLSVFCAILSIIFCFAIKKSGLFMKKFFKNPYLRGVVGALLVVLLTVVSGTFDYNGAGMNIVEKALSGDARKYDFVMKIVFTAITLAAGFKGGEIVPTFFVGATFGCVMGPVLGIESTLSAAIGMTAVFCGVTNCPIASIILATEMFGADGLLLFAVSCAVSYLLSGHTGLYKSQDILYSKLTADNVE